MAALIFLGACYQGPSLLSLSPGGQLLLPPAEPRRPFEVLEHLVRYDLDVLGGETWIRQRYRVVVHSAAGLRLGDFVLRAWPGARITGFSARARSPSGEQQEIDLSDFESVPSVQPLDGELAGSERRVAALPRLEPGTVLEVSSRMSVGYPMLSGSHVMDGFRPARRVRLELAAYDGFELKAAALFGVRSLGPRNGVARFELSDVPRETDPPPLAPWPGQRRPRVRWRLATHQTWTDALAGYVESLRQLRQHPPPLKPRLHWGENPQSAVESAVSWLRGQVRIVAPIQLMGLSRDDRSLVRRSEVTPDDFTRLLWLILMRSGREYPLALIPGAEQPDVEPGDPTPAVGSYDLVLVIDAEAGRYFDPYCRGCPVGELAREHRSREGVLFTVRASTARAWNTRAPKPRAPERTLEVEMHLGEESEPIYDLGLELRGPLAGDLRGWLREHRWNPRELREAVARGFFPQARGGVLELGGLEAESIHLRLRGAQSLSPFLRTSRDHSILSLESAFPQPWLRCWPETRKLPVFPARGPSFEHRLHIRGVTETSSAGQEWTSRVGRYTWSRGPAPDGGYVLRERLELHEDTVAPEHYPEVRDFFRAVERARRRTSIFPRTSSSTQAPGSNVPSPPGAG